MTKRMKLPSRGAKSKISKAAKAQKSKRVTPQLAVMLLDDKVVWRHGNITKEADLPTGLIDNGTILNEVQLGAALKTLLSEVPANARRTASLILPTSNFEWGVTHNIEAPDALMAEKLVQNNISMYMPTMRTTDPRRQTIATARGEGRYDVITFNIDRSLLTTVYRTMNAAGLNTVRVEPRLGAELRQATDQIQDDESVMVLHLEPGASQIIAINGKNVVSDEQLNSGQYNFERSLMSNLQAPTAKLALEAVVSDGDQLSSTLEMIAQALDDVRGTFSPLGYPQPTRTLTGGYAARNANVATLLQDTLLQQSDMIGTDGWPALTGALMPIGEGIGSIDLQDPSLNTKREKGSTKNLGMVAVLVPVLLGGAATAMAFMQKSQQETRERDIQAQIDKLAPMVREQKRLQERNEEIGVILSKKDQIENLRERWPQYLDAIVSRFPDAPVGIESLESADSKTADTKQFDDQTIEALFKISGDAKSREAVIEFLSAFERSPFVVSIDTLQSSKEKNVTYSALIGIRQGSNIGDRNLEVTNPTSVPGEAAGTDPAANLGSISPTATDAALMNAVKNSNNLEQQSQGGQP